VGGNDDLIFDGSSMWINKNGLIKSLGISFKTDLIHRNIMTDVVSISPQFHPINQIENALILGIKDYVNKCGFKQVMLGLSGGIDSAITAVLAVEALGCENVFAYALPSEYSSRGSITDAYDLAKRLNISCQTIPINHINSTINDSLSNLFANYTKDYTEENIQARIRGLLLMAISNKTNRLLLTTGNKSELAVGYCTLYGDMNGCLSVLGDITKTEVYELARWINAREYKIPQEIIKKPPSAELKPNQKDSDSLPDYEILDEIIIEYINNQLTENEIIQKGYCKATVEWTIAAIRKNEYKRQQSAPSIKVSSKAFGSGRQFPIVTNWTTSS
jgi:NAD+ synthetase